MQTTALLMLAFLLSRCFLCAKSKGGTRFFWPTGSTKRSCIRDVGPSYSSFISLSRESILTDSDSSSSSISSSDSESNDELLEAVSRLFKEDDDTDGVDRIDLTRDRGTIVARVIPRHSVGFEEKKPMACRYVDDGVASLRLLVEKENEGPISVCGKPDEGVDWRNEDLDDKVIVLEVQLFLTPQSMAQMKVKKNRFKPECAKIGIVGGSKNQLTAMKLERGAKESAMRTLRRLHLSIAKRLGCMSHGGSLYVSTKGKDDPDSSQSHQGTILQGAVNTPNEPSVWVRESSTTGTNESEKANGETEILGSCMAVQRTDSQRRFHLRDGSRATSAHSPEKEMTSASLWYQLAGFEGSRLYFGIRPSGPLLPLEVDACPPTVLAPGVFEDFQSRLFVGVPIVVSPHIIHATHCVVAWFIEDKNQGRKCLRSACFPASEVTASYTPVSEDLGKSVSVLFLPMRSSHSGRGCEEAYKFRYAVEPLPPMPIVSPLRDAWTGDRTTSSLQGSSTLRVVTYNLLADWYAGRTVEAQEATESIEPGDNPSAPTDQQKQIGKTSKRTQGFYTFCAGDFLRRNRRFPMIVAEILSYMPDLITLQEVDRSVFHRLLMPVFRSRGYQGFFSSKALMQSEGCAMFWSLQVFEEAGADDMRDFPLCEFVHEPNACGSEDSEWEQCTASIEQLLDTNTSLRNMMKSKLGQIVQIASLRRRNHADALVVGNTHLFYHPMADHIRAIQAFQACRYLDIVRRKASKGGCNAQMILCGDLNSNPLSGAVQLLLQGRLGPDNSETWKHVDEYTWDMGGEEYLLEHGYLSNSLEDNGEDPIYINESFEDASEGESVSLEKGASTADQPVGLDLRFPSTFPRLISAYPQLPAFTNYSIDFAETFDYMLASEPSPTEKFGLYPIDTAPMPTKKDMLRYGAMPNEFMPSDHVSLVSDLAWIHPE